MGVTVLKSYPQITQLWLKLNKTNRERESEREGVRVRPRERKRMSEREREREQDRLHPQSISQCLHPLPKCPTDFPPEVRKL
jgi:hypothetical protein